MSDQIGELDIEQPSHLLEYLRREGRIGPSESPKLEVLKGGVSNRTVLIHLEDSPARVPSRTERGNSWVLKQALSKLRVATDWFSDPRRIHREADGMRLLAQIAPVGTTTRLVFEDDTNHIIAMEAVPSPHENWKTMLLAGDIQPDHFRQFAALLGTIHNRGYEIRDMVAQRFEDRTFFETLRIDPYYRHTASRHPQTQSFFQKLIEDTLGTRLTIVHGDYSPKNVLVYQDQLILLDHEVIHYGDPAFDIGFSLTHLLSKARHLPQHRSHLFDSTRDYWAQYAVSAPEIIHTKDFEERSVRHTLACLLARVDGKSPLEYLDESARRRQRETCLILIEQPPATVADLISRIHDLMNKGV